MNSTVNQLEKITYYLEKQLYILECIYKKVCLPTQNEYCEEQLLTVNDVAKIFRNSPSTIRRWIKTNKIRAQKLHDSGKKNRYYIIRKDVMQAINNSEDVRIIL
ncbi:helix-turn-helix domain-containing protein [Candidatus Uabimicrobium sp. HlEnr_7]|uniref:helix-turn-helix domain-containing protein n=1 Tax=Candidatus Uabimicrobium helgolandensis TaxID=3095367 RepID=UPI00355866A0